MIELIPAIDIIDGKCVRLTKGDYNTKKIYRNNPVDVAKQMEDLGFRRLHLVDLDGAKSAHVVNLPVLEKITAQTKLHVDFGGGVKSDDDIQAAFYAGATYITVGSLAVKEPDKYSSWIEKYGSDRLILGADVHGTHISINGWKENSALELFPFLQDYYNKGVRRVLCTDISKDGMLGGPSIQLYKTIMHAFPDLQLIASGGVASLEDIKDLNEAGIPAVVFGKAMYEGRLNLPELIAWAGM